MERRQPASIAEARRFRAADGIGGEAPSVESILLDSCLWRGGMWPSRWSPDRSMNRSILPGCSIRASFHCIPTIVSKESGFSACHTTGSATLADWMSHHQKPESRSGQSLIETVRAAQAEITTGRRNSDAGFGDDLRDSVLDSLQRWHQANGEPLSRLAGFDASDFCLLDLHTTGSGSGTCSSARIVHGDLKPANILIRNDGEPALIDFNLAGNNTDGPQEWRGGTLPYMAPEQLQSIMSRSSEALRPEGDVYSLGVIMFETSRGSTSLWTRGKQGGCRSG